MKDDTTNDKNEASHVDEKTVTHSNTALPTRLRRQALHRPIGAQSVRPGLASRILNSWRSRNHHDDESLSSCSTQSGNDTAPHVVPVAELVEPHTVSNSSYDIEIAQELYLGEPTMVSNDIESNGSVDSTSKPSPTGRRAAQRAPVSCARVWYTVACFVMLLALIVATTSGIQRIRSSSASSVSPTSPGISPGMSPGNSTNTTDGTDKDGYRDNKNKNGHSTYSGNRPTDNEANGEQEAQLAVNGTTASDDTNMPDASMWLPQATLSDPCTVHEPWNERDSQRHGILWGWRLSRGNDQNGQTRRPNCHDRTDNEGTDKDRTNRAADSP